jgi:transposase
MAPATGRLKARRGRQVTPVLIMDRHPVHCAGEVRDFLRKNQIDYWYLPPYSPELNPIEEVFSKIKNYRVFNPI